MRVAEASRGQQVLFNFVTAIVAVTSISLLLPRFVSEAGATFTCTQFIGYSQTNQWIGYAATTMNNGGPDRVQLLWTPGGAAHLWADPNFAGWSNPVQSPCVQGASAPDRVIMDITHDAYLTTTAYADPVGYMESVIRAVVSTIRQRYPSVRQIVLQPVVGGPNHITCASDGAQQGVVRASYNHPTIHRAALRVVGGIVVFGADPMVRSCADYADSIGHLTTSGASAVGASIGQFYLNTSPPAATPTATTAPVQSSSSSRGYSATFNGTTAYADVPHAPELNVADWTVETWFKDEYGTYDHPRARILTKGDIASSDVPYFASIDSNLLFVGFRAQGTARVMTFDLAANGISANAWHHLAASFQASSGTLRMYIDGVERVMAGFGSATTGNDLPLTIGRSGAAGEYWRGKLDDVRLWNITRSAADIRGNYQRELSGSPAGLVGNWRFNEGSGTTAADSAGSPQPATLRGGAGFSSDSPMPALVVESTSTVAPALTPTNTRTPGATPLPTGTHVPTLTPAPARTATATPTVAATRTPTPRATAALATQTPTPPRATQTPTTTSRPGGFNVNGRASVVDGGGQLLSWVTPQEQAYDRIMRLSWDFLLNSAPRTAGLPDYYLYSSLDVSTLTGRMGSPNNPASTFAMLTESALAYYAYSGDSRVITLASQALDHMLANGLTDPAWAWASVPFASGDPGSPTYRGANDAAFGGSGRGDGIGVIEPDKVGELGLQYLRMYQFTGNAAYRTAAINAANALASRVRTGNASQSPWPFRVNAQTGAAVEQYCACVIKPIELFDELVRLGLGNTAAYQSARTTAWNWLMTYPMQNNQWAQYFEDMPTTGDTHNWNQMNPGETAKYLLRHRDRDPQWQAHVSGIISWIEANFGKTLVGGARPIGEQIDFNLEMGSHTSRYAAVNAMLAEATGSAVAREKAYRAFNWATYITNEQGINNTGPGYHAVWWTDGYGDFVRQFMAGLGSVPEWTPPDQNRLLRSSSVVRSVTYGTNQISYTTFDAAATDVLHLTTAPARVTAGGVSLSQQADLAQQGWTYDASTGALRIRHDTAANIVVSW